MIARSIRLALHWNALNMKGDLAHPKRPVSGETKITQRQRKGFPRSAGEPQSPHLVRLVNVLAAPADDLPHGSCYRRMLKPIVILSHDNANSDAGSGGLNRYGSADRMAVQRMLLTPFWTRSGWSPRVVLLTPPRSRDLNPGHEDGMQGSTTTRRTQADAKHPVCGSIVCPPR